MKRPDRTLLEECDSPVPELPVAVLDRHKTRPGPVSSKHWHEEPQFILLATGEAVVHCHSGPERLGPGEAIILNPGELHYIENLGTELDYTIVRFDLGFLASARPDRIQLEYIRPIAEDRLAFRGNLHSDPTVIGPLRHLIDDDLASDLELPVLAAASNMSKAYFCRLFKRLAGMSSTEYITRKRIERAKLLLEKEDCGVSEAAFAVGFNDSGYFSRVFKRWTGMSPAEFKRQTKLHGTE
jgi:AraC-like DNA-binding protein